MLLSAPPSPFFLGGHFFGFFPLFPVHRLFSFFYSEASPRSHLARCSSVGPAGHLSLGASASYTWSTPLGLHPRLSERRAPVGLSVPVPLTWSGLTSLWGLARRAGAGIPFPFSSRGCDLCLRGTSLHLFLFSVRFRGTGSGVEADGWPLLVLA